MVQKIPASMLGADAATQAELDAAIAAEASSRTTAIALKRSGDVIQKVRQQTGVMSTGTTQMPVPTVATITDGTQVMTVTITPTSADSILQIEVCAYVASSVVNAWGIASLHAGGAALAEGAVMLATTSDMFAATISHEMTAGTTAPIVFTVRAGIHLAGTMTFNGTLSTARFGGTLTSFIKVTEIKV